MFLMVIHIQKNIKQEAKQIRFNAEDKRIKKEKEEQIRFSLECRDVNGEQCLFWVNIAERNLNGE